MHFIVKLFPEITIKSTPVRKRFIKQLRNNLRTLLRPLNADIDVQRDWEKIEISSPSEDPSLADRVASILAHTPGIANFARVKHSYLKEDTPLDDALAHIFHHTLAVWEHRLAGKTFCVRVKRNGQHPFKSTDVERYVGGGLNQHAQSNGVNLKHPDITIRLEIRQKHVFIFEDLHPGLGGFPLGTQDPVLSLISGGFDSTVSSYLTMKRGLRTHFCFFNLGGKAHELGVKEVAFYLWNKFGASHTVKFITIPFEDVVSTILSQVDNAYMGVVLKRMMLRAASTLAQEMDIQALVTGESVAQVSSQTLTNLSVIDRVTNTLVLRPLVTMDKGDIIDCARRIGTESFAAQMPEYCGVISVKPTTKARFDRVQQCESRFDFSTLDAAIQARQIQYIDEVINDLNDSITINETSEITSDAVIIDIRHPDEQEINPLSIHDTTVMTIPFYALNTRFADLDASKTYLLFCEKGVMSRLHAEHLLGAGFNNVGVYRTPKTS